MSADRDSLLAESLRARADAGAPIEAGLLLHGAVARGRRRQARARIAAATLTATAVVAAGGVAVAVLPQREPSAPVVSSAGPSQAPGLLTGDLARMPDAGQPGADARPDLVGTDPHVVHFSVDALAGDAYEAGWRSRPGVESATVLRLDGNVTFDVARAEEDLPPVELAGLPDGRLPEPTPTTVGDRPAMMSSTPAFSVVTWQPVDGLWARASVSATDRPADPSLLARVRFDQSRRIVLPLRATGLPDGMSVRELGVTLRPDSEVRLFMYGRLVLADGPRRLVLNATGTRTAGDGPRSQPAGPYLVSAVTEGERWTVDLKHNDVLVVASSQNDERNGGDAAPVTRDEALEVVAGLRFASRLDDTAGWF
ncbi:hypothetical protein J2S43_004378 [Catenuloplanes nepalensis]|uniref:Uncharacterized protein n=1 Tax=Catenuloplanes nepalensis TaxID=587533 RepID=A0ABT9MWP7_9ACTN|nr:hypothetical protein [Catenuloplanes nepalensis]MDP9795866.1 hypothetical protein [Catenuloplanes nepalensis]